eukprot:1358382-Amorphochlora_amoeboformis.AAC.1
MSISNEKCVWGILAIILLGKGTGDTLVPGQAPWPAPLANKYFKIIRDFFGCEACRNVAMSNERLQFVFGVVLTTALAQLLVYRPEAFGQLCTILAAFTVAEKVVFSFEKTKAALGGGFRDVVRARKTVISPMRKKL